MVAEVIAAMRTLSKEKGRNLLLSISKGSYKIGINSVGENMEIFIKDLLTGQLYGDNEALRQKAYDRTFSRQGSSREGVDAIVRGGDAFEIKKETLKHRFAKLTKDIQLNSSPPRSVLRRNDPRLVSKTRITEGGTWIEKDVFYVIGATSANATAGPFSNHIPLILNVL